MFSFQWLIFKHFWMHFMKLQRAYETLLRFGDDENDGRVIIMGNQTMNFDTYFYDVLNVGQLSREELLRFCLRTLCSYPPSN